MRNPPPAFYTPARRIEENGRLEEPHMKSYTELDGEQGCRVPLSIGVAVEASQGEGLQPSW